MKKEVRSKRSNGEGSIVYVESRKQYMGAITTHGKRKYFYAAKKADVVKKMNQWREEHSADEEPEEKLPERTFEEEILDWLHNIKKDQLKTTTYDRVESTIKCHIIKHLGGYYLSELTDTMIKKELFDKVADMSDSSVRKIYDALNECLRYFADKKKIQMNPMDSITCPKHSGDIDARKEEAHSKEEDYVEPLTVEEMAQMKNTVLSLCRNGSRRYVFGSAYILILNTGMRMGEALALTWKDVNFENNVLRVNKNLAMVKDRESTDPNNCHKLIIQNTPKTKKSNRTLPLNKEALAALEDLQEQTGWSENGYVIHTENDTPMSPRNFARTYRAICERGMIEHGGIHALRHTFATRLFEKGIDIAVISKLLGHSSVQITYQVYIHVIERLKIKAVEALDLL